MTTSKGILFVISAPSGAGKTSLVHALLEKHPELCFSISYTTRAQRPTEIHGRDYFFVERNEFERMVSSNEFLEHAKVFDNYYGTAKSQVDNLLEQGKNVILEIDWQGAQQIRKSLPECVSIFILPPSRQELERRLRGRGTDSDEVIARRLRDSVSDMNRWTEFDYAVINDVFADALRTLIRIVESSGDTARTNQPALVARIKTIIGHSMNNPPIAADSIEVSNRKSIYPPVFAKLVEGRVKRRLGDHFGLSNFGINLTELAPGSASALLHHHAKQDEFIYIVSGTPTLVLDDREYILKPGDCCGFKAGNGVGHQLINKSNAPAVYLEVGDRTPGDSAAYPNDDLSVTMDEKGAWVVAHKDGSPY
jgi:guanylate kinase